MGADFVEWLHDRLLYGAPRAAQAGARLGLWEPIVRPRVPLEIRVYDRRPPDEITAAWTKTADLLGALAREASAHEARLLVVYVPNRFEVDPRAWELTRIAYDAFDILPATATDAVGNSAGAAGPSATFKVDNTAPAVASVTLPADGVPYQTGTVPATFSVVMENPRARILGLRKA